MLFHAIHTEWMIRILIAALCGGLIGYERSSRNKGAGLRTHVIIALGSSLIVLVSKYGFIDTGNIDGSRIAAQIVSGVGFLGAGVIFVKNGNVSGLTTAAGMWATSGVGMCIGAGMYDIGILTTVILIGFQVFFHKGFFLKLSQLSQNIQMEIFHEEDALKDIRVIFEKHGIDIHTMKVETIKNHSIYLDIEVYVNKDFSKEMLADDLMKKSYFKMLNYN